MVADQLFGGLVGGLIVDRGVDVLVASDRVLLITDITVDAGGAISAISAADRATGREGRLLLVNGQHQPTITTPAGGTERWRRSESASTTGTPSRSTSHHRTPSVSPIRTPVPSMNVTKAGRSRRRAAA